LIFTSRILLFILTIDRFKDEILHEMIAQRTNLQVQAEKLQSTISAIDPSDLIVCRDNISEKLSVARKQAAILLEEKASLQEENKVSHRLVIQADESLNYKFRMENMDSCQRKILKR
jgi:hypothetical protein